MPVYYSQEINLKNSTSAFNEDWGQQMRNYKATVPIIQSADNMYECPFFTAWVLCTVATFDSHSMFFVIAVWQVSTHH